MPGRIFLCLTISPQLQLAWCLDPGQADRWGTESCLISSRPRPRQAGGGQEEGDILFEVPPEVRDPYHPIIMSRFDPDAVHALACSIGHYAHTHR